MYTSDIKKHKPSCRKNSIAFFAFSAFCLFFGTVYDHYGRGVHSFFMSYLFIAPLTAGIIYLIFALVSYIPPAVSRNMFNAGIGAVTGGSLLLGIFEIAGTSSAYVKYFFIIGFLLITSSMVTAIFDIVMSKRDKNI